MNRYSMKPLWMALLLSLAPVVPALAQSQIQHVVVIMQENRSTDNLFHGLPGADTANTGKNSKGQIITLEPIHLASHYGPNHLHSSFLKQYDNGKMDGADLISVTCNQSQASNLPSTQSSIQVCVSERRAAVFHDGGTVRLR